MILLKKQNYWKKFKRSINRISLNIMNLQNQSYTGYWYIPSKEIKPTKWYGTVHVKENNQIVLEFVLSREDLNICFPNLNDVLNKINNQVSIPFICGYGKNINKNDDLGFTLLDLVIVGYSSSGLVSLKLEAKSALTYYHIDDPKDLLISSAMTKFDGLDTWMDKNGFKIEGGKQEKQYSTNINYDQPDSIELLNNEFVKIYFYFRTISPAFSVKGSHATITQSLHVNFEFRSPNTLETIMYYNEKIQNLFTFIFSRPTQRIDSQIKIINYTDSTASDLIYSDNVQNKLNDLSNWNFIFSFSEVEDNFPFIFQNWLRLYNDYEPALDQYFDNLYFNYGHIISRFISTLSILEIYFSRKFPESDKLGLKKKIDQLILDLGEINTQTFQFETSFSEEVILIRKYYVHGNQVKSKLEDYMLSKEYISKHIRSLENLFKTILLIELGLSENEIIKFIKRKCWCSGFN